MTSTSKARKKSWQPVLVIGAGGIGSPIVLYLDSAGVGSIILGDNGTVDLTSLQRQTLHTSERIDQAKVASGKTALAQINPDIQVIVLAERAAAARLAELIGNADALDCSDNLATQARVQSRLRGIESTAGTWCGNLVRRPYQHDRCTRRQLTLLYLPVSARSGI